MKETITKRFFAPIWKCDKIEYELEKLESEGWRLEKISGFRKFKFVSANPKSAKYFFTFSLGKETGMIHTEYEIKRTYKATEISGSFIEGLTTTSVYRITRDADLSQRKLYRNRYLSHLVLQYVWIGLLFTALSIGGFIASYIEGYPFFGIQNIIFFLGLAYSLPTIIWNLFGWLQLRKQYSNLLN